jgi:hypothetical protein
VDGTRKLDVARVVVAAGRAFTLASVSRTDVKPSAARLFDRVALNIGLYG